MAQQIADRMHRVKQTVDELNIRQYTPDGSSRTTQQYGFMKFDDNELDSSSRLSQYVRLHLETNAKDVVKFMRQAWELPPPDLIISVTGGAKHCDMSARLRKIFQRGLVAAAVTTNAWLITAGTNAGVVTEVGEALSNYRYKNNTDGLDVPCIGIGSWGYTAGNDQLEDHATTQTTKSSSKGLRILSKNTASVMQGIRMDVGNEYCVRNYVVKERPKKRCELEPNHTHFLLFDDGQPSADSVLPLRADIEKWSRHIHSEVASPGGNEMPIPIVMVLVEGGPSSVRTICQALESNTPVVVVKESGRAADLVADLHACYSESEGNDGNGYHTRPQTAAPGRGGSREVEINAIFLKAQEGNNWIDEVRADLCRVLNERKQLVTIFKFDSKRHHGFLEDAILESLLNAAKFSGDHNEQHRRSAELKLALAWHKFDYAKTHLLTDMTISKWKEEDLRRALVDALRRGHVDFVELLIEFGTSLEKLTHADLNNLYTTITPGNGLPTKDKGTRFARTREDFYKDYFRSISYSSNICNEPPSMDGNAPLGKFAPRDLFFWALFLNRFELATYLCSKTWNPAIAPLFGTKIYRRAARLVLDPDTKKEYEDNANQFDAHASAIIDRCFDNDENFAVDLVKRLAGAFDNIRPLYLAQKSDCRSFLASKCVQKFLDNTWFGYINYKRQAIDFRVFMCALFLPLLPIFCVTLPYVQKHKKLSLAHKDPSKSTQKATFQTAVERTDPLSKADGIRWSDKIRYFYQAPIVRFYYYMIFFVTFLGLFSFVLLVDYFPLNIYGEYRSGSTSLRVPITEIILHIFIWSLMVEEARQFIFSDSKRDYFSEVWNVMDIVAIVFYLVGFITRFFVTESLFTVSKIFLCLDLILWYVRTLNLFAAYEKLGPKLVMIFNTMKDLLFFVCFIFIFLLAFSIASWSLITTTTQVTWAYNDDGSLYNVTVLGGGSDLWSWALLRNVTNYGIWKIFGQVDQIDGSDAYSAVAFVLAIIFLAIANVLLLNVLVALFNVTIQNVQSQSHQIWRYQRFVIVFEYYDKPPLPPPFNNIYYLFVVCRWLFRKLRALCERHRHVEDGELVTVTPRTRERNCREEFKVTDAMQRESAIADDYWRYTLKNGKKDQLEVAIQNLERKLDDLTEQVQNTANYAPTHERQPQWMEE